MQTVISAMYDSLARAMQPDTRLFKLNAIWIEKGIRVYNEYNGYPNVKLTHRIAEGDILTLDESGLADYNSGDNFKILSCIGTIDNSVLQVTLKSIDTDEIKTVTI